MDLLVVKEATSADSMSRKIGFIFLVSKLLGLY